MTFKVSKIHADATIPTRGSYGAAGYDLSSCENTIVLAKKWKVVNSGIAIQIPQDCYARIAPRSGLAVKKGINTGAGVVDSDYRNAIGAVLFNHSDEDFEVKVGDRIAQIVFEKIYTPELKEVDYDELTSTERGTNGFGSTGIGIEQMTLKEKRLEQINKMKTESQ